MNQNLAPFSNFEIDAAQKLIETIDSSALHEMPNNTVPEGVFFNDTSLPRLLMGQRYKNCSFQHIRFSGVNAQGITAKNCSFEGCDIESSNFKYSDFSDSEVSLIGSASSFDSSDFSFATITDASFSGCSFSESCFYKAHICNSQFSNSEFVASIFEMTTIKNADMSRTNIDYAEFDNPVISDSVMPYWSILHVARGFSEIMLSQNVSFSTQDGAHIVPQKQYLEEIQLLKPFLYQKSDFFALANIYLFEGNTYDAYVAIQNGIKDACNNGALKTMRYFCRMASLNDFFTRDQMRMLYREVENALLHAPLTAMQYKNYLQELDYAKRFLIDRPFGQDTLCVTLQTTIPNTDYAQLSSTLKLIDGVIEQVAPQAICHKEIRHNSPIEIVIELSSFIGTLMIIFAALELAFGKATTYIERVQNIILNHRNLKEKNKYAADIQRLEAQIEIMKETIHDLEQKQARGNSALILPGTEMFESLSYRISARQYIPKELRTYSSK